MLVRIHIWPSEHWVDDEAWSTIVDVSNGAEKETRQHLPTLERDLYLIINPRSSSYRRPRGQDRTGRSD